MHFSSNFLLTAECHLKQLNMICNPTVDEKILSKVKLIVKANKNRKYNRNIK